MPDSFLKRRVPWHRLFYCFVCHLCGLAAVSARVGGEVGGDGPQKNASFRFAWIVTTEYGIYYNKNILVSLRNAVENERSLFLLFGCGGLARFSMFFARIYLKIMKFYAILTV